MLHLLVLVEIIDRTSEDGPIVQSVEYVYDSQNRWIAKSVDPDGPGPEPSTDTHFIYDGNQIVLQLDDAGAVTNRYLWGKAVDQILADEQIQPDGTSDVLWPLTDHLNTVRDLAVYNPETNLTTIASHLIYDAFGQVTSQTDPTVTTLFGFTARPFALDTGLQNNLNRWYDAKVGRWISEDPIGFAAADANLYRYVGNEVTSAVDPTGLEGCMACHGGFNAGLVTWEQLSPADQIAMMQAMNAYWPILGKNGPYLEDFLLGQGEASRTYYDTSALTIDMRNSPGVALMREKFYAEGCKDTFYRYESWLAARDTVLHPSRWDKTDFASGGWRGIAHNNDDGKVTFSIMNRSGLWSFAYHELPDREPGSTGPMRTIYQLFIWTEDIPQNRCPPGD